MPQTQEHVDILNLYGIKRGLVALTKADLVDEEWLELVEADIAERLAATSLRGCPIIPVSGVTGFNLDVLKEAIGDLLDTLVREEEGADPLLWIDRVFTIKGAGTVVTGTLLGGLPGGGYGSRCAGPWASRPGSGDCRPTPRVWKREFPTPVSP